MYIRPTGSRNAEHGSSRVGLNARIFAYPVIVSDAEDREELDSCTSKYDQVAFCCPLFPLCVCGWVGGWGGGGLEGEGVHCSGMMVGTKRRQRHCLDGVWFLCAIVSQGSSGHVAKRRSKNRSDGPSASSVGVGMERSQGKAVSGYDGRHPKGPATKGGAFASANGPPPLDASLREGQMRILAPGAPCVPQHPGRGAGRHSVTRSTGRRCPLAEGSTGQDWGPVVHGAQAVATGPT